MIGGRIQMMFGPPVAILPLATAGKIRALAVTSAKRSALAPDLPTIAETVPGFDVAGWYGLAAPAGNAEADRRQAQCRGQSGAAVARTLSRSCASWASSRSAARPRRRPRASRSEVVRWTKIIRDAGIKLQ